MATQTAWFSHDDVRLAEVQCSGFPQMGLFLGVWSGGTADASDSRVGGPC